MAKQTSVLMGERKSIEGFEQHGGGRARKTGTATAAFKDNFFDIGFLCGDTRISCITADLEVTFLNKREYVDIDSKTAIEQINEHLVWEKILAGETLFTRNRSEKYIAVRGATSVFVIEAW